MNMFRLWKKCAKFQKDWYKIVWGVVLTMYPHSIYWGWKIKSEKNDLTIISKPHAHPHTMKKTHAKFHNDRYKTVRGVALIRGIHCLYIASEKWLSSQCGKSDKNDLTIISKPHTHSCTIKKTHAKFQNDQYKTVRGVVLIRHQG